MSLQLVSDGYLSVYNLTFTDISPNVSLHPSGALVGKLEGSTLGKLVGDLLGLVRNVEGDFVGDLLGLDVNRVDGDFVGDVLGT